MYIEYYIIENLLINYIIISCTYILTKRQNNYRRKVIGAGIGSIYSVAYLYPDFDILFTLPSKIIIMTIITLIAFEYKGKKDYTRLLLVFYMVNIFISGTTYFIIYFTGIDHMKISFLIVCAYVSCELLKYIYRDIKFMKYIKEFTKTITINLLDSSCQCSALLDSGNLLKDPISKNDVIIVKSSAIKDILPSNILKFNYENIDIIKAEEIISSLDDEMSARVRMIPYKHAGSSGSGIIIGIKPDSVFIDNKKIGNVILGISDFNDEEYGAILNPCILSEI
ncbi:MAG: sigma-E processing peptidase SpoIIGA [Romboutsia sp.]|uniref:sigma-E processing peptidase SpoIIGA n=1 Tax=Romboutsia sp. TaxID=1965302 RepID=UPI003F3FBCBA